MHWGKAKYLRVKNVQSLTRPYTQTEYVWNDQQWCFSGQRECGFHLFVSIALAVESCFPAIDIYLGGGKVTVLEKIEKDWMQWCRDEGVKEHPILWMFYVENIQNCTQDKLLLNICWKVGKDQVRSPFKPRTLGRALSLTCLRGWWAHVATAIADALLSRRAVPVFSALFLTDTFTVRKDWLRLLN